MTYQRFNLRNKVHRDAERAIDFLYEYVDTLSAKINNTATASQQNIQAVRNESSNLVASFATRLVGGSSTDPLLETLGTGTGTVTNVATGTGLTGGPITSTGTIAINATGVAAGSYVHPSFDVNAQGQLTTAASTYTAYICTFDSFAIADELEDTLAGGPPSFSAVGTGVYQFSLTGAFPANHVWLSALLPSARAGFSCIIIATRIDDDTIQVQTFDDTITAVDVNGQAFLEIRVYP